MAELAVIMSMITVTSTATSILGIIKRRCGAARAITDLASKCAKLVDKVLELLKTLEGGPRVPNNTRGISTALNHRREELDEVLKNLEKMNRRTKRTHPIDITEKFITAQGWARKMEEIHSDLCHLRNGIENIVSNWESAQFVVTKFDNVVTIDVSRGKELGECAERWGQDAKDEMLGNTTVNYVHRYLMTMVQLTDTNKAALNRYGDLDKLSLPDALYDAGFCVGETDTACSLQLTQRSAELLHPKANFSMGRAYQLGLGVEKNLDLAVSHFLAASSHGHIESMMNLMKHYHQENDRASVLKCLKIASRVAMEWWDWIMYMQFAIAYSFESNNSVQLLIGASQSECAFHDSICHFFGLGTPKSNEKALDALQVIDSSSYSAEFKTENSTRFYIYGISYLWFCGQFYYTNNCYKAAIRQYAEFLFEKNQFLSFFLVTHENPIFSRKEWESYALDAVSKHCLDAHIFLAHHFAWFAHPNECEMKRHLRIAADAGRSDAQSISRHLFGE